MQLGQSALKNPDVDEKNSQQKLPMRIVNVRVYARIVICLGMVLIGGTSGHAAESKHDRKQSRRRHVSKSSSTIRMSVLEKSMAKAVNLLERPSLFSNVPKDTQIQRRKIPRRQSTPPGWIWPVLIRCS